MTTAEYGATIALLKVNFLSLTRSPNLLGGTVRTRFGNPLVEIVERLAVFGFPSAPAIRCLALAAGSIHALEGGVARGVHLAFELDSILPYQALKVLRSPPRGA